MTEHILHSIVLGYDGKWKDLERREPETEEEFRFHWFHMDRENLNTQKWLFENDFDELVVESLTDEDTRPRTTVFPDGVLLNMRCVNTKPQEEPQDMLSMRMFIQRNRIISTSVKNVHILKDIIEMVNGTYPPASRSEFLAYVIELITDRVEAFISEDRDQIYELEWHVIDQTGYEKQSLVSDIRRSSLAFARYLSPQKDALVKLLSIKEQLFTEDDKIIVAESINSNSRYLEDLTSVTNRCHILKDDMNAIATEKMNRNMYTLSIITAVFLPLTFLTGLFGVNLGGIPGGVYKYGFAIFSVAMVVVFILLILLFRVSKRF